MEDGGRNTALPHIRALDGARGLAVAAVVLFHGGHLTGGYLGVDFFFTLSGFLITSLLLAEANRTDAVGLGGFWARRARRLLPALGILMIGVAIYSVTLAQSSELTQIRGDAFSTLFYVANWHEIFSHNSYFALFSAPSPLNHTWSLAIEEQFYVIWPLGFVALLARFRRATPKAVLVTSLTLATVSSALMIVLYAPGNPNRDYFGTDTRAAAILFGAALAAALAIYGPATKRAPRIALEVLGVAGAVVLAVAWTRLDGQSATLYRGGFLVCGLAATAIIAAAVHPERGVIASALSFKPLCALGLISYGVYLYHWPIDVALDQQRAHLRGWPLLALQTAVTLGVAIASYVLVEQPIRHGRVTTRKLRALAPAGALALVVALAASTAGAGAASTSTLADLAGGPLVAAANASRRAPAGATRVMLVGNSVANLLAPGFRAIHASPPLAVLDASVRGCGFPPELTDVHITLPDGHVVPQPPCDPSYEAGVIARFKPDIVFWIISDVSGTGGTYRGRHLQPCTDAYDALYRARLKREIGVLGAHGARVVLTTEAYSRFLGVTRLDPTIDCVNRVRRAVAASKRVPLADLFAYTCPDPRCDVEKHGQPLRPDGLHYQGPGGEIVAQWLMDQAHASD